MPQVAARRDGEKNEADFGTERFIPNAKRGKILGRKKGGSCVIDTEVNVDANEAELFSGRPLVTH